MSLIPPETVKKLQPTLHAKAKDAPSARFHTLYDKVDRHEVLAFAYRRCATNGGAPGVDGQTFADIEAYGVERWLGELTEALRTKTYRPQAVRRVNIPKAGQPGRFRPLGIPTIKDRVAETAVVVILEPIFEVDLQPEPYAYRPGRSALDAVKEVHSLLNRGYTEVGDADLRGYCDDIPHSELLKSVARRVSDGSLLHLLKMWWETPVEEAAERGHTHRTTRNKDTRRGSPQGSPLSPLLANLYMRRFVLGWKVLGHERRFRARIVNYADDLVICCRGQADQALEAMRNLMQKLKLTVNEEKTRICHSPQESVTFLGYTIGQCYSYQTGRPFIGTRPSQTRISRLCREVSRLTGREWTWRAEKEQITALNRRLVGWAHYFCLGRVTQAYRNVNSHVEKRLRQGLCHKPKVRGQQGTARFSAQYLHPSLGVIDLETLIRTRPWAKA